MFGVERRPGVGVRENLDRVRCGQAVGSDCVISRPHAILSEDAQLARILEHQAADCLVIPEVDPFIVGDGVPIQAVGRRSIGQLLLEFGIGDRGAEMAGELNQVGLSTRAVVMSVGEDELGEAIGKRPIAGDIPEFVQRLGADALFAVQLLEFVQEREVFLFVYIEMEHLRRIAVDHAQGIAGAVGPVGEGAVPLQNGSQRSVGFAHAFGLPGWIGQGVRRELQFITHVVDGPVLVVEGWEHAQPLTETIILQPYGMQFQCDRFFGFWRAQGDESKVICTLRADGYDIVLVSIHIETFEEPGIAGLEIDGVWRRQHSAMSSAQRSPYSQFSPIVSRIHGCHLNEPGTRGNAGIWCSSAREVPSIKVHVPGIDGLGSHEGGNVVAGVPDLERSSGVGYALEHDYVVQELQRLVDLSVLGFQAEHHQFVARKRGAAGV